MCSAYFTQNPTTQNMKGAICRSNLNTFDSFSYHGVCRPWGSNLLTLEKKKKKERKQVFKDAKNHWMSVRHPFIRCFPPRRVRLSRTFGTFSYACKKTLESGYDTNLASRTRCTFAFSLPASRPKHTISISLRHEAKRRTHSPPGTVPTRHRKNPPAANFCFFFRIDSFSP